jgi:DNA-binding SARP family transcriptional activator
MKITMFGALHIEDGERRLRGGDLGGAKPRALLELLLLARGRTVGKEQLADVLWGDQPPQHAAGTLEHYVSLLRRRMFTDQRHAKRVIVTEPGAYRLDTSLIELDLDEFDRLVRQADFDEEHRTTHLRRAVLLAGADLLDDAPFAPWAGAARDRYRASVARAHLALARDALAARRFQSAVHHAEEGLRSAPYSEEAYRIVMVADHAAGHSDLVRTAFHRCRQILADDLGVDPTGETEAVAAAVDAGVPAEELLRAFLDRSMVAVAHAA